MSIRGLKNNPEEFLMRNTVAGLLLILFTAHECCAQKRGQALIDSLQSILSGIREDTNKCKVLNKLGTLYSDIDPAKGATNADLSLELSEKLHWQKGVAESYNILGMCAFYRSDYDSANKYWIKSLYIYKKLHDNVGMIKVRGNMAAIYNSQGDFSKALEEFYAALKDAEDLNDSNYIASNLGNIGSCYESLKNYPKALEFESKALRIFELRADTESIALFLNNIGNVYSDQHKYSESLDYQLNALSLHKRLGNKENIATDMGNIGDNYALLNDYVNALRFSFGAFEIAKSGGFKLCEARSLGVIGDTYYRIAMDSAGKYFRDFPKKPELKYPIPKNKKSLLYSAAKYLVESNKISADIQALDQLVHNYLALSGIQEKLGLLSDALESNNKYIVLKDSVFSLESKIKIATLETKRELELKAKQIQIDSLELEKKHNILEIDRLEVEKKHNIYAGMVAGMLLLIAVSIIGYRNLRLSAAKELSENKLNAFQARMNPHFIFNVLTSIQSLILNKETEASIDYLAEFAVLMRKILDNSAKSKVLLSTEIEMLKSYIQLEHLRFDCFEWKIDVADDLHAELIEVPGMIVQPFVENSILHGLMNVKEGGMLTVKFARDGRQIICEVEDNGIGREKSAELNAHRNQHRQSHGINIASSRLSLLNDKKKGLVNKITYIDKKENGIATGTKVIIQLPVL